MLKSQYHKLPKQLQRNLNETELWVQVGADSRVTLKGADNEDSLRGLGLNGIIVDEVASMRHWDQLWDEVLRPALTDKKGWAWFIGTPKGYNHFYELYKKTEPDYASFHFTSYDNPFVDPKEIDKAKEELTENAFAQEYMADFRKFTGLVYKEFDRAIHILKDIDLPGSDAYYRTMDFGATNPTACLWIRVDRDENFYVFDEYFETEKTTDYHAGRILAKHPQMYFRATFGDPAGKQQMIDFARFGLYITPANKKMLDKTTGKMVESGDLGWVRYGIDLVSQALKINSVTKKPRLFIGENCPNLLREFENYRWEERKDETLNAKDVPVKADDHGLDGLKNFMVSYKKSQQRIDAQPPRHSVSPITGY